MGCLIFRKKARRLRFVFQAVIDFAQIASHPRLIAFIFFLAFKGINGFDLRADLPGQRLRDIGACRFLRKNRRHVVRLAVFGKLGKLLRAGLPFGEDILHAVLLQPEIAAEVSESGVPRHKRLLSHGLESFLVIRIKVFQLGNKIIAVLLIISFVGGVRLYQRVFDVFHFGLGAFQADPDVGVVLPVLFDLSRIRVLDRIHPF